MISRFSSLPSSDGRTKPLNIWAMQSVVYIQWKDENVMPLVAWRMRMALNKRQTGSEKLSFSHWVFCFNWKKLKSASKYAFTSSKSFIYQQMHFISVLENIKNYITTNIKISATCFGLRTSSGSLHMSLAKVTFIKSVKIRR